MAFVALRMGKQEEFNLERVDAVSPFGVSGGSIVQNELWPKEQGNKKNEEVWGL